MVEMAKTFFGGQKNNINMQCHGLLTRCGFFKLHLKRLIAYIPVLFYNIHVRIQVNV